MISYNKAAVGEVLYVNFGADISAATGFTLTMEPEVGDKVEKVPVLGASDVTVGDETFLANQYVTYSTEAGVFDFVGRWRAHATATLPGEVKATRWRFFRVLA